MPITDTLPLPVVVFLGVLIVAGLALLAFMKWYDYVFMERRSLRHIDSMSGFTFEKYLSVMFQEQGYQVEVTPDTGDFGADLVIRKNGVSTAVQAKRYKGNVGVHAVQEVIAARHHYRCQRAMVVTNSYFTPAAWQLAKSTNVWLVDRKRLETMVAEMKAKKAE